MKRVDMIIIKINFYECLPIVIAQVGFKCWNWDWIIFNSCKMNRWWCCFVLLTAATGEHCASDTDCRKAGDIEAYCKSNGACRCDPPYFGDLCDQIQCSDPFCNGHGTCNTTDGICRCDAHYGGTNCSELVCPGIHHNCSNNGLCVMGNCKCFVLELI